VVTAAPSHEALAVRVDAVTSATAAGSSLDRGSLRFARTIAMSVGIQGPTAGVIIGPAIIASIVGAPGSLAQVLALVAMSFVAYAFVRFTRAFNTSGSVLTFNSTSLGPAYGFMSAWLLLLVYGSFASGVYASTADIAQSFFASVGVHGWWLWFALVGAGLAIALAYLSIGISSLVILGCEAAALLLISAVGIAVLVKGGYHHHPLNASSFRTHGVALSVLTLGVVGAFGQFSGFEGAATLGEEARQSTRTIPAAVTWSLLVSAGVYIFFTWVVYNAYPSPAAVAADPAPLVHVADRYLDPTVGKAVNLAGTVSAFGAQLALLNAASRLLFAVSREGTRPGGASWLLRVSPRFRSPVGALSVVSIASVAGLLGFGFEPAATRAAALAIEYGAYLLVVVYLMTVVAALVWAWRTDRRPLPLVVLAVGVLVMAEVIYHTFHPFPATPFNRVVVAAAGSAVLGGLALLWPGLLARLRGSDLLKVTNTRRAVRAPEEGT
jgi:amino acid transporter